MRKGVYNFVLSFSGGKENSTINLLINNVDAAKAVLIPATIDGQGTHEIIIKKVSLFAGANKIKIYFYKGGFSFYGTKIAN